jgi:hypothetical protein
MENIERAVAETLYQVITHPPAPDQRAQADKLAVELVRSVRESLAAEFAAADPARQKAEATVAGAAEQPAAPASPEQQSVT